MLIKAEPGPFYVLTDFAGKYAINLFDTSNYMISVATQDTFWQPPCTSSYNIHVVNMPDTTSGIDFAIQAAYYCPRLTVDVSTSRLRRCFTNTYTLTYHNTGT